MTRNKIIAIGICVILTLAVIQVGIAFTSYSTAEEAVKYAIIDSQKYKQLVQIIDNGQLKYALFITEKNKVAAVSLNKTLFGWRLGSLSGIFDMYSIPKNSGLTGWAKHETLLYGIINDNRIDSVLVNGNSAKVIKLENNLKLWYTIEPNHGPYDLLGIDRDKNVIHKIKM